ncbi:MAG: DUF4397 domain-containing protein [Anaerolineae bacterium]|nr:DUF4397 domain-containing protein [Anaerolineae bacterium]
MSRRFLLTLTLVFSVLLVGITPTVTAQDADMAHVRLVHGIPDAPPVDILIDGQLTAAQVSFADYTDYIRLADGDHTITVQAGEQIVAEAALTVASEQALTVIVTGSAASPEVLTFEDDLSPLVLGNTRVNAIHAAPGTGAVDVVLPDGSPVLQGLEYGNSSGGIDIPANIYPLAVVPAGSPVDSALLPPTDFYLQAGMLYRVAVVGGPTAIVLEAPVQSVGDSILVSVAHAIEGAPAVDVYNEDVLVIPGLEAGQITRHVALPLGTYEISVRTAGEDDVAAIASISLDLSSAELAGQARTIAAIDRGDTLGLDVYADPVDELASDTARINVINAIPGADLAINVAEIDTLVPVSTAFTTDVPAGPYSVLLTPEGGSAFAVDNLFNGGTLYTLLVTGTLEQPAVLLNHTALNFQPGSAAALVPAVEEETPAPVEEAPVETTPEPEAIEPTVVPTEVPTEPSAPPAAAQAVAPTSGVIGLVYNLNPGANLQLREYPRADARSLGLVQVGTVVSVLGRAGEPDFVDLPDLAPGQDLDPNETWLLVEFVAADGSTTTAWTVAQYIQVTENSQPVRLADLDPVRSDTPGSTSGATTAAATAAPVDSEFFAVVYNLNPDANLNIRRTPDRLGEVLAQVPAGTVLEPSLILDDYSWVYVTYRPADGGEISGWTSAEYVQFVFRGNAYFVTSERFEELLQRSLLAIGDGTERGTRSGISGAAATVAPSNAEFFALVYNLNPDANLNLRRTPDTLAEVLAQLPPGTIIEPQGLLDDYSWAFVIFRPETGGEISGWVATEFVQFVFRGQNYFPVPDKIEELFQRSLLTFVDETQRGEISAEAAAAAGIATPDMSAFRNQYVGTVVIDPGANLHLRRTPNAVSESLALIPSGANMLVIGRTASAEWLQVEYDNASGWVASTYVDLSMNGRQVLLEDVPVVQ